MDSMLNETTAEKAIQELTVFRDFWCVDNGYRMTIKFSSDEAKEEFKNEMDMAIKAVEKQNQVIPIKIDSGPSYDAGWLYRCPVCGSAVGINVTAKDITEYDNFCANCGQCLNWTAIFLKNL